MAATLFHPTALVRLHIRLEPLGQPDDDQLLEPIDTIPLELTISQNRWTEADTFEATLDLEDFPMDPRIIRGMTFEAFLANTDGLDPAFWSRLSTSQLQERRRFAGVVDDIESVIDDQWRKVRLRGRDYTAFFLDVETSAGPTTYAKNGVNQSLVQIITDLKDERETTAPLLVEADDDVPDIFPATYKLRGTDATLGGRNKKQGDTAWDVIQELALEAGVIVYVDLDTIRIRRPTTIFSGASNGLDVNGFRWVLGSNVSSLTTSRKMGRITGANIRAISYCPDDKTTRIAEWPTPEAAARAQISAAPVAKDSERKTSTKTRVVYSPYVFRDICSDAQLLEIAKQLHEKLRHSELEGSLATADLQDSDGRNVLELSYGDPLTVDIADQFASILTLNRGQMARSLAEAGGYPPDVADKMAQALDSGAIQIPFYVEGVEHRYEGADQGYTLEVKFRSRKQVELDSTATA